MSRPVLIIGNKNYSSWSLRPWLLLKMKRIAFDEVRIPLYQQHSKVAIQSYAPPGNARYAKVPILHDGHIRIWDSLAICEYAAERWPETHCWPADRVERARARAVSAEMHSGFRTLRSEMPMNCRRAPGPVAQGPELKADITRVVEIWTRCREAVGSGPFLFGNFCIADAMYAPVALRFSIYTVDLPDVARAYVDTVLALPALQAWVAAAQTETEVLPQFQV